MDYRSLTEAERQRLEAQGCTAADWSAVQVADPFLPELVCDVRFSGSVQIGRLDASDSSCGIFNTSLHDCTLGNDILISHVPGGISSMDIASGVVIECVDRIVCEGESTFGNGVQLNLLNESGARDIPLYDELCAPVAYWLTCYRYRTQLLERLEAMIADYVHNVTNTRGTIGADAVLRDCGRIENCRIGPHAHLQGVTRAHNASINSRADAPVYLSDGVILDNAIISSNAEVRDGALLSHAFVGQGARVGRQASIEHSALFANAEVFHGEFVSVLAGPYTVSHHKSTLLIATMTSFFNAGSGTNQSNHLYKLGPLHQGVMERGAKTGSGSYLLWPSRVGACSTVIGHHARHFDSAAYPFSLLLDDDDRTLMLPGATLFSVGSTRDAAKWEQRDRRALSGRLDPVHAQLESPWLCQRMEAARTRLEEWDRSLSGTGDVWDPDCRAFVARSWVRKGMERYDWAIRWYRNGSIVHWLARRMEQGEPMDWAAVPLVDATQSAEWLDVCGLLAPRDDVEMCLQAVERHGITSLSGLRDALERLHAGYSTWELSWCVQHWISGLLETISEIRPEDCHALLEDWLDVAQKRMEVIRADVLKEFSPEMMIGYGLDGGNAERDLDFTLVRGTMEDNAFLQKLECELVATRNLCARLHDWLEEQ